jgi:hypothetical protein
LAWSTGLEFTSDKLKIIWNFDARFKKEEFKVASFVFKLDLIAVLKSFGYCPSWAEHSENLRPVWAFDTVKASHESVFFLGSPRTAL